MTTLEAPKSWKTHCAILCEMKSSDHPVCVQTVEQIQTEMSVCSFTGLKAKGRKTQQDSSGVG